MLLLLGSWLVLIVVCFSVGITLLHRVRAAAFERAGDRFVVAVWLGIIVLANALLALSLLVPLSPTTGAIVAGGLLILSLTDSSTRDELAALPKILSPTLMLCALFLAIGVAAFMARPVTYYDTGLYHFGVIKWLNMYGVVRGLALVQDRFGVASAWYALAAPFNAEGLETRTSTITNGLALLMAVFHLLLCAARYIAGRGRTPDLLVVVASMVFIPIAVVFWIMPVSAAPDFSAIILTLVVAWTIAVIVNAREHSQKNESETAFDSSLIAPILATGALTIKFSALPLAVVAILFYLFRGARVWRRIVTIGLIGLVLISPIIAYSMITSGCLLFPVSASCMDVPWSVGAPTARNISEQALIWGRWGGPAPPWANSWNWLWPWLGAGVTARNAMFGFLVASLAVFGLALSVLFTQRRIGRWVMLLGIVGLALFLMLRALNIFTVCVMILGLTTLARRFKERNWLLAISFSGIALSIISAPDLRFGLGYVAVLLGCFVIAYRETLLKMIAPDTQRLRAGVSQHMALATILVCGGLVMIAARMLIREQLPPPSVAAGVAFTDAGRFHLFVPPSLPVAPVTRRRLNDIDYYQPERGGGQCWAAELPCAWENLPEDIALRDPSRGISAGFVHRRRLPP